LGILRRLCRLNEGIRVRGVVPRKQIIAEGVLVSDGTEQTVIEVSGLMNLEGYIDLSNMESGDVVALSRYVKIQPDGEYKLHAREVYSGSQPEPLIRFPFIAGYYGIKITLQQTSGTLYKEFPYQFFKET